MLNLTIWILLDTRSPAGFHSLIFRHRTKPDSPTHYQAWRLYPRSIDPGYQKEIGKRRSGIFCGRSLRPRDEMRFRCLVKTVNNSSNGSNKVPHQPDCHDICVIPRLNHSRTYTNQFGSAILLKYRNGMLFGSSCSE
jgi:hypothetical protein